MQFGLILKMASKPSSVVLSHFNIPDNRTECYKAQCKYCEESISATGKTTLNLLVHLKVNLESFIEIIIMKYHKAHD